ncbi:DNA/RNA non-specific endonuclease [Acinetobacter sp. C26M]|uniref:DNA/RNA non-specific endonuclease n=1 Tax=unclassified Acinetobacter TaxID=196816 RepID=UPI002036A275|nr:MULTISPECIES: DNA/RNA non-specific endonuclease [unclassified Acinetobacter]USA45404.1 DNA/RNA non-specific endonuclease [Acinetobacter sp. C26M]USA48906.1 DNA/RNA non-specific endonuclease [Acinetobacter sp. C26G]
MVGIVSGNGLGLFNSSFNNLGKKGLQGNANFGQAQLQNYVNIADGNLIIRQLDQNLSAIGKDIQSIQTYNSKGVLSGDTQWGSEWSRRLSLVGDLNTAGSKILITAEDGHQITFNYSSANAYISTEGDGAYDKLSMNGNTWTITDGKTLATEVYEYNPSLKTGRLVAVKDSNGTNLAYSYDALDRLISIKDLNSTSLNELIYNYDGTTNRIKRIDTKANGITNQNVYYEYDSLNRLSKVITDLTPNDNSIADQKVYSTSYSYELNSSRIASITQSDGTSVQFSYELDSVTNSYRVKTVRDSQGLTTFTYAANKTTVENSLKEIWEYSYDANQQLTSIKNANAEVSSFSYDGQGNVTSIVDNEGNKLTYRYDSNGNLIEEYNHLGKAVKYSYINNSQLATITEFNALAVKDANGNWILPTGDSSNTNSVYDSTMRLRFVISAEGGVVEYSYNSQGQLIAKANYQNRYTLAGGIEYFKTEAWSKNSTRNQLSSYEYDVLGNLKREINYSSINKGIDAATGLTSNQGVFEDATQLIDYVYDPKGLLLQKIIRHGADRQTAAATAAQAIQSFTYDGLGRILTEVSAAGTTSYSYAAGKITVINAANLVTTQSFDSYGRLLNIVQSATNQPSRTTSYTYDEAGRLVYSKQPTGNEQFNFYDKKGRLVGVADSSGLLIEYVYNKNDLQTKEIRYANAVNSTGWLVNNSVAKKRIEEIRPAVNSFDRVIEKSYDSSSQLKSIKQANGTLTEYSYDNFGNVIQTKTGDRISRYFYNKDNQQVGVLDAEGYLVETIYNTVGQKVQVNRYSKLTTESLRATGTLAQLKPIGMRSTLFFYNAQNKLVGSIDEKNFITAYIYDEKNNTVTTRQYSAAATTTANMNTVWADFIAAIPATNSYQESIKYYDNQGRLSKVSDTRQGITTYGYDNAGRVITEILATGSANERRIFTRYNAFDDVTHVLAGEVALDIKSGMTAAQVDQVYEQYAIKSYYDAAGRKTQVLNAAGQLTTFYYDKSGRLTHSINAEGNVVETSYTLFGEVKTTTQYVNSLSKTDEKVTDLAGAAIPAAFSNAVGVGKRLKGGELTTTLSNLVAAIKNASKDNVAKFEYDKLGNISKKTDAESNSVDFLYNQYGELDTETRQVTLNGVKKPVQTAYTYSKRGELKSVITDKGGLNQSTSKEYDAFGRVTKETDAKGNITSYDYFADQGRSIQVTSANNSLTKTTYDAWNRVLTVNSNNNISSYSYDDKARTLTVKRPEGLQTITRYNEFGDVIEITAANNGKTTYLYNKDGKKTKETNAASASTSYVYDKNTGLLKESTNALGLKTEYIYDDANRVQSQIVTISATEKVETQYRYDGQGQRLEVIEAYGTVNQRSTQYNYDKAGRLTSVVQDATGIKATTTYAYDETGREIRVVDKGVTTVYSYDALGRRLSEIKDPTGEALKTEYRYDLNGNLTRKIDQAGNSSWYIYDNMNRLSYTVNSLGETVGSVYDVNDRVIAQYRYTVLQNVSTWLVKDIAITTDITVSSVDARTSTRFVYNKDGLEIFSVDAEGSVVEKQYNELGKVTQIISYDKAITVSGESLTQEAVRAALQTASAGSRTESYYYDALGRVVYTIDAAGYITRNDYNALNNITYIAKFNSATTLSRASTLAQLSAVYGVSTVPANLRTVQYYDKLGRKIYDLKANSILTRYSYDEFGNLVNKKETAISYVALLDLLRTKDANGIFTSDRPASTPENYDAGLKLLTDAQYRETNYYYDKLGRVKYIIDALGYVTRFNHNALNNVVNTVKYYDATSLSRSSTLEQLNTVYLASTAPPYTVTGTIYSVTGRKVLEFNEMTFFTYYSYDALGNVIAKKESPLNVGELLDLLRTKDANGVLTPRPATTLANINQAILLVPAAQLRETQYYYDKVGRLTYDINALGYVNNYRYDVLGQLISSKQSNLTANSILDLLRTKDASGNFTTPRPELNADNLEKAFKLVPIANYKESYSYYDKDGRLNYSIDAMDYVTRYSYDAYDNVISTIRFKAATTLSRSSTLAQLDVAFKTATTLPAHTLIQYGYDALNRKIKETDAEGFSVETGYDAFGNTIWVKDKLGNKGYFYYDALNRNTAKIDAAGYYTFYSYDAFGNQLYEGKYLTPVSGLDKIEGANGLWNAVKVVPTSTEAAPTTQPYLNYGTLYTLTNTYQYDKLNRKIKITDVLGNYEEYTYNNGLAQPATYRNKLGGVYSYVYDRLGRLIQETLPEKSANSTVINTYEYDAFGNRTKLTEAKGLTEQRVSVYQYDALNRLTTKVGEAVDVVQLKALDPNKPDLKNKVITTGVIPRESYQYDGYGNQILKTDANGAKIFSYYDNNGRKIFEISPVGQLTQWEYNADGQVTKLKSYETAVSLPALAGETLPVAPAGNIRVVEYGYDKVGRQIQVKTPDVYTYDYDVDGKGGLLKQDAIEKSYYDGNGNLIRVEDAKGGITYYYYDAIGRKVFTVNAGGFATQWTYDYDVTNQVNTLTEIKYAKGLSSDLKSLQFNQVKALLIVDTNNDRKTLTTFDRKGRVSKTELFNVKYTDGTTTKVGNSGTSFTYNGLDQVLTKTDITGTVRTDYDKLGRETLRTFGEYKDSNNVAVKQRIASVYNGLGLLSSSSVLGANDAVTTDDRVTQYGYDKLGRLIKETNGNIGHSVNYAYDLAGNQTWVSTDRKTNSTVFKTDETLIEYNQLGKETVRRVNEGSRPSPSGTAVAWKTLEQRETRYNVFGEITGKRLVNPNSTTKMTDSWQEVTEYNNQGKVWKSNANNGVTRYYLYDKNGNATLQLDTTGSSTIAAKTPDQLKNLTGVTYTETVYDKHNQVVAVRQPKFSQDSLDTTLNLFSQTISRTIEKSTVALTDNSSSANKLSFNADTQKLSIQANAQAKRLVIKYWPTGSTATVDNTLAIDMQAGATAGAFVLGISAIKANANFNFSYSSTDAKGTVLESSTGTIKRSVNVVDMFSGGSVSAQSMNLPNTATSTPIATMSTNSVEATLETTYSLTEVVTISQQVVNGTQKTWVGSKEDYINSLTIKLPELNSYNGNFVVKIKIGATEIVKTFSSNATVAIIDGINSFVSGQKITIQVTKKHNDKELELANYNFTWKAVETFNQVEDANTPSSNLFLNNFQLKDGKYYKNIKTAQISSINAIRSKYSTLVFNNFPPNVTQFTFYIKYPGKADWYDFSQSAIRPFIDGNGYAAYVGKGLVGEKYEFQYFGFDGTGKKVVGGTGSYTYIDGSSTPIVTSHSKLSTNENLYLSSKASIASSINDIAVIENNKLKLKNQKQNTSDVILVVDGFAIFMEKNTVINGQFDIDLTKLQIVFGSPTAPIPLNSGEYIALDINGNVVNRQKIIFSNSSSSGVIATPVNIEGNGFLITAYNDIYDAYNRYVGLRYPVSPTTKSKTPYFYFFNQKNSKYIASSAVLEVFNEYDPYNLGGSRYSFSSGDTPGLLYCSWNGSDVARNAGEYTFRLRSISKNELGQDVEVNSVIGGFTVTGREASNSISKLNLKSYVSQEYASNKIVLSGQPTGSNKITVKYGFDPNNLEYTDTLTISSNGTATLDVSDVITKNLVGKTSIYYSYETLDASGKVINRANGFVSVGLDGGNNLHNSGLTDRWIDLQPAQNNGVKMEVYYRKREVDANGDFISNPIDLVSENKPQFDTVTLIPQNGIYRWDINNLLTNSSYEYFYQLYDVSGEVIAFVPGKITIDNKGNGDIQQKKWTINGSGNEENQIIRSQNYNAFGEIISETDGNGNTTISSYNTLGKLIEKKLPTVDIRKADGTVVQGNPTLEYGYDLAGRLLVTKDANGNINKQSYINGRNLETGDWLVATETHADAGQVINGYDTFGNLKARTNENGVKIDYYYDISGNLTQMTKAARTAGSAGAELITISGVQKALTDTFGYDELGNRITVTNALGNVVTTEYDALGRVVQTKTAEGVVTNVDYAYDANILNINGTKGGITRTETDVLGKTIIDEQDYYGRNVKHTDKGGHVFSYTFNAGGWLTKQINTQGQNIDYTYYSNGYVKEIKDNSLSVLTTYRYDDNGNRIEERYQDLNTTVGEPRVFQNALIGYDSLNRKISVQDQSFSIHYDYDANGNILHMLANYRDVINTGPKTQDFWYSYDSMNRFTVSMGKLNSTSKQVERGDTGVKIEYDKLGQRLSADYGKNALNSSKAHKESYTYTTDGYLEKVENQDYDSAGVVLGAKYILSTRYADELGRVKKYVENKENSNTEAYQTTITDYNNDNQVSKQTKTGSNAGLTTYNYYADKVTLDSTVMEPSTGSVQTTKYEYEWWDSAKQQKITTTTNVNNNPLTGTTDFYYDENGHIRAFLDNQNGQSKRFATYINNSQGMVLQRNELINNSMNRYRNFYYVNGQRVGDLSNDGPSREDYVQSIQNSRATPTQAKDFKPISSADFDQNFEPINAQYPSSAPTNYVVNNGDTLQSIALSVWGDASMWYMIADLNGLSPSDKLTAGQVLSIPNKVTNIHNNSETFRPYNPGEAIGDTQPTVPSPPPPPKPKKKCGGIAQIVMIVVAVVATIYTAGAAAGLMGAITTTGSAFGLSAFGTGLAALSGTGMTLGYAVGASMIGAAVGSAASQLAGKAMGVVDSFSWSQVGISALTAGVTAGVGGVISAAGSAAQTANQASWVTKAAATVKNANWAVKGAVYGTINYGSNYIANQVFGNNQSFSWNALGSSVVASVAASGMGARGVFDGLGEAARPYAYSLVGATTAATIDDKWFGGARPDYLNVSMAAIANTVGRQFGENAEGWFDTSNSNDMVKNFNEDEFLRLERERSKTRPLLADASYKSGTVSDTVLVLQTILPTINVTPRGSWIGDANIENALEGVGSFFKYASKFTPLGLVQQDIPLVANAARSVQTFMNNRVADITDVRDHGNSAGMVVGAAVSRPFLRMLQGAVNGAAGLVELGTDPNSRATAWSGIKTFAEHPIDNTATGASNYWNNTSWNEKLEDGFVGLYGAGLSGGTKLISRFDTSPHIQSPLYFDTSAGRLNSGLPIELRNPIVKVGENSSVPNFAEMEWSPISEIASSKLTSDILVEKGSGSILYEGLDHLNRPTGAYASITPDMLKTGTPANSRISPPGWAGNGIKFNQARGHLIGNQLGGSGDIAENLVTLQQNWTNSPAMRGFEGQVRKAVEAGEVVQYSVKPIYNGENVIPTAVTLSAKGNKGYYLDISILNPIGYAK